MTFGALHVARTGLDAQGFRMQVIANNLANVNTTGFKRDRASFEDLLYQQVRQPGGSTSSQTQLPSGLQLGTGVRVVSTSKDFQQGNPQQTGRSLDVMVNGRGFFEVLLPDGSSAEVTAVYVGIGQGFYVNGAGTVAGIGGSGSIEEAFTLNLSDSSGSSCVARLTVAIQASACGLELVPSFSVESTVTERYCLTAQNGLALLCMETGEHFEMCRLDTPLSAVNIFVKDLGIVLDAARQLKFPLPLAAAAHQLYLATAAMGLGGEDDSAVVKYYAQLAGLELPTAKETA